MFCSHRNSRFKDSSSRGPAGLEWAPLDWQLYFLRALARIGLRQPETEVLADFRRARFLEPSAYQVPFEEGKAWLRWRPNLALTAWREALRRRPQDPSGLYSQMIPLATEYDRRLLPGLRDFASGDPGLTITWLDNLWSEKFVAGVGDLLAENPTLAGWTEAEKARLFELWSARGGLDELARAVAAHPEWARFAWPGMARWHAAQGDFPQAWALVRQNAPAPALPAMTGAASIPRLEQQLVANRHDYAAGYALYRAQTVAGKIDDALATARHFTAQAEAPRYFYFLQAESWAAKQNWERAWRSWEDYQSAEPRR